MSRAYLYQEFQNMGYRVCEGHIGLAGADPRVSWGRGLQPKSPFPLWIRTCLWGWGGVGDKCVCVWGGGGGVM